MCQNSKQQNNKTQNNSGLIKSLTILSNEAKFIYKY